MKTKKRSLAPSLMYFLATYTAVLWFTLLANADSETYKINTQAPDLQSSVQYWQYNQAVTAYTNQINEMIARWYTKTQILDLLAIKSMECNSYTSCLWINASDVWPFQINRIHTDQYNKSIQLHYDKKYAELYLYQLTFSKWLIDSYMDRFCNESAHNSVGKKYTTESRFKCVAVSYNWHPTKKVIYSKIGWEKRKIIKEYLNNNY